MLCADIARWGGALADSVGMAPYFVAQPGAWNRNRPITLCAAVYRSAALLVLLSPFATGQGDPRAVDFDRDVRPILSARCFKCHGPDARRRKAKLRLDTAEGAFAERKNGAAVIVKGEPASSELVRRITHDDVEERMPPADSGLELTEGERRLLIAWIEQGAVWQEHWAFRTPAMPRLPAVQRASWPLGAIDRFTLAALEARKLSPSPEADRPR